MEGKRSRWLLIPMALAMALALVACGSGGTGDGGSGTAGPTAASEAPAADESIAPAPASRPPAASAATGGGGGGGGVGDVCSIVTADDMARIVGKAPVVSQPFPGPPDTCDYQADDAPLAAIVVTPGSLGAGIAYEAMKADAASEEFSGIGDRALFNTQSQVFLVMKGGNLVTIAITDVDMSDAQRLDAMKQAGQIAASKL